MTATRKFVQADPSGRGAEEIAALVQAKPAQMGRVLATFRMLPSGSALAWLAALVVAVAAAVGLEFAGLLPEGIGLTGAAILGVLVVLGVVLVVIGFWQRYRVCEHGLVVNAADKAFKWPEWYAVPWASIDPARVRLARGAHLALRHTQADHERLTRQGVVPTRQGLFATRGLSLVGANTGSDRPVQPFAWWMLGTARPGPLVDAIERAMVNDGYPAAGMAQWVRSQPPVVLRWDTEQRPQLPLRGADDPVLWRGR